MTGRRCPKKHGLQGPSQVPRPCRLEVSRTPQTPRPVRAHPAEEQESLSRACGRESSRSPRGDGRGQQGRLTNTFPVSSLQRALPGPRSPTAPHSAISRLYDLGQVTGDVPGPHFPQKRAPWGILTPPFLYPSPCHPRFPAWNRIR